MQTDIGCHAPTASCSGRDHTAVPHYPQPRRAPQRLSRCRLSPLDNASDSFAPGCSVATVPCRKARRQQVACQAQSITGQIVPPAEKLARSSRVAVNDPEPAQQDELRRSSSPGQGQTAEERVGVLLLNLGGPETLNDVQPFLFNLFRDPDIIRLPQGSEHWDPPHAETCNCEKQNSIVCEFIATVTRAMLCWMHASAFTALRQDHSRRK